MTTTKAEIREWLAVSSSGQFSHMLVVTDEFDYNDFPRYVQHGENVHDLLLEYQSKEMTKVMEVYNFSMNVESQIAEKIAWHPTKELVPVDGELYPEHDRMKAAMEEQEGTWAFGEFIMWLNSRYVICEWNTDDELGPVTKKLYAANMGNSILAEYLNIDLKKIEAEKEAMLEAQRELNTRSDLQRMQKELEEDD